MKTVSSDHFSSTSRGYSLYFHLQLLLSPSSQLFQHLPYYLAFFPPLFSSIFLLHLCLYPSLFLTQLRLFCSHSEHVQHTALETAAGEEDEGSVDRWGLRRVSWWGQASFLFSPGGHTLSRKFNNLPRLLYPLPGQAGRASGQTVVSSWIDISEGRSSSRLLNLPFLVVHSLCLSSSRSCFPLYPPGV